MLATSIAKSAIVGLRSGRNEFCWRRSLQSLAHPVDLGPIDIACAGRYVVSSDSGIYYLADARIRRISAIPAFGIAISGSDIYLATWYGEWSVVLVADLPALIRGGRARWRELYRVNYLTPAGRIHQIGVTGNALWLANTARNTLTKIDRHSGEWCANIGPFKCAFGHPILSDHNHINSVLPTPKYLVFAAFKINDRSAFGLVGAGRVRLYAWPNMGVHDCIFRGNEFLFSDTCRMWQGAKPGSAGGVVVSGGRPVDKDYFDSTPAYFVRGIAGTGNEMLVGNSHVGAGRDRFAGKGELILTEAGRVKKRAIFPGSQVYDIIDEHGRHFDTPAPGTFKEAALILDAALGPPIDEFRLRDVLAGPQSKKWDETDIGRVQEYLEE